MQPPSDARMLRWLPSTWKPLRIRPDTRQDLLSSHQQRSHVPQLRLRICLQKNPTRRYLHSVRRSSSGSDPEMQHRHQRLLLQKESHEHPQDPGWTEVPLRSGLLCSWSVRLLPSRFRIQTQGSIPWGSFCRTHLKLTDSNHLRMLRTSHRKPLTPLMWSGSRIRSHQMLSCPSRKFYLSWKSGYLPGIRQMLYTYQDMWNRSGWNQLR